jgi:hypothetical protein
VASVLLGHFHLRGGSSTEPSLLPCSVQVSPDKWPLPGWNARALARGSIAIHLPLQDAAFGALGPPMHCMRAGC